jgi:hypothetical protein
MTSSLDHIRDVLVNEPLKAPLRDGSSRMDTVAYKVLAACGGFFGLVYLATVSEGAATPKEFKFWSFLTATGASSIWYAASARLIGRESDKAHIKGLAVIAGTVGTLLWAFSLPEDGRTVAFMFVMGGAAFVAKGVDRIEGDRYATAIHMTSALIGGYALHRSFGKQWHVGNLTVSLPLTVYGGMQLPFIAMRGLLDALIMWDKGRLSDLPDEPTNAQWKAILDRLNIDKQRAIWERLSDEQLWPIVHLFKREAVSTSSLAQAFWLFRNGEKTDPIVQKAFLRNQLEMTLYGTFSLPDDERFLYNLQTRPLDKFDELLAKVDPSLRKRLLRHYLPHLPPRKWKELSDRGMPFPHKFEHEIHPDQILAVPQELRSHNPLAAIGDEVLVNQKVPPADGLPPDMVVHLLAHCTNPRVAKALRATLPSPPPIPLPWVPWKGAPTDRVVQVVPADGSEGSSVQINAQAAVVAGGHFASALTGGWHTSVYKVDVPHAQRCRELVWLLQTIQEGQQPSLAELVDHLEMICDHNVQLLMDLFYRRLAHEYRDFDLDSLADTLPHLPPPPADLIDYWAGLEVNRENYRFLQLLGGRFEDLEHQARAATEWRLAWPEGWTPEAPLA